jgi:hypothetical protein
MIFTLAFEGEAKIYKESTMLLMRHGVDNVKHRPVGNPKRKV